ncbi:M3 family metallopeptidase [Ferrimonas balearica]|uniref:M3 family metallopeptidase n=1 Tax=Ferrimonas balearica TaxID=44012 RepID=UPI001C9A0BD9|nr:M3 family metallopeptidase [Ferrimonas balearica]MBY5921036.1 M3 family metallopeptidase [Ferrimonas balearica]MBY5996279.1 M3 family metallopeptidase [Ferrimonas balearica]
MSSTNPLLGTFDAPFGLPPFAAITDDHFAPALEAGMAAQLKEVAAIINNPEAPSLSNTIEALERSGTLLARTRMLFENLSGTDTNPVRQSIEQTFGPKLAAHSDAIALNVELFRRIEAVWQQRDQLDGEARVLTEKTHQHFVRGGAQLEGEARARLAEINQELASLQIQFAQNLLAQNNGFIHVVEQESELAGLPAGMIQAAAEKAEALGQSGKWAFGCDRTVLYPFLTYCHHRGHRQALYQGYLNRADNGCEQDNKANLRRQVALRQERAALLGFETHAHYELEDRMVEGPEAAQALMDDVWQATAVRARKEAEALQARIHAEGNDFTLAGWDWWYYAEQVRQAEYALDDEQLKPYFSLDNVIEGAFHTARKLFGIDFKPLQGVSLYHEEARVWEVVDAQGEHLGVFIGDYFTRDSKRGGAWMTVFREQSRLDGVVRPIVQNVCNFPKPQPGEPALLDFEHVRTLFHEFGHALHGLLTDCHYASLSGTNVARDFVEFPSQVLEHWALQPEVLAHYARHVDTGEVIPESLVSRVQAVGRFNQGFQTGEFLAAALLDMAWHTLEGDVPEVAELEAAVAQRIGLPEAIAYRYRSTAFAHIFAGGYSAGYYSYLYSAVLDGDGFAAFTETGDIFDPALAGRLHTLLRSGGTDKPDALYRAFRGRAPQIDALLENRGLN